MRIGTLWLLQPLRSLRFLKWVLFTAAYYDAFCVIAIVVVDDDDADVTGAANSDLIWRRSEVAVARFSFIVALSNQHGQMRNTAQRH